MPARSGPPSTSWSRCRSPGSRSPPTTPGTPAPPAPPCSAPGAATALANLVMFTLGVLALSAYGASGLDVVDALLAVPFGLLAVLVLVAVEVDEAFANTYSAAVSAQNVAPRLDRRVTAVCVGTAATVLALSLDVVSYEPFLFLLGAVFVPLAGVFLVAYYLLPRGAWDTSENAPARPALLLPWAAGFLAYQLTVPTYFDGVGAGWTTWWAARQADLGIDPAHGLSASHREPHGRVAAHRRRGPARGAAVPLTARPPARRHRRPPRAPAARARRRRGVGRRARRAGAGQGGDRPRAVRPRRPGRRPVRRGRGALPGQRPSRRRPRGRRRRHPPRRGRPAGARRPGARRAGPRRRRDHPRAGVGARCSSSRARATSASARRTPPPPRTACPTRSAPRASRAVCAAVGVPVIAIGGVTAARVPDAAGRRCSRRRRRRRRVGRRRPRRVPCATCWRCCRDRRRRRGRRAHRPVRRVARRPGRARGRRGRRRPRHRCLPGGRRDARPRHRGVLRRGGADRAGPRLGGPLPRLRRRGRAGQRLPRPAAHRRDPARGLRRGRRPRARRPVRLPPGAGAVGRAAHPARGPPARALAEHPGARGAAHRGGPVGRRARPARRAAAGLHARRGRPRARARRAGCWSRTAAPSGCRPRSPCGATPSCWRSGRGAAGCRARPRCRCARSRGRCCGCAGSSCSAARCAPLVRGRSVYLVPYGDDGLVVGATVEELGFDARVTAGAVLDLLRDAAEVVPGITELELAETLASLAPRARRTTPRCSAPATLPGLVLATGHFRNGVLLTPVTADVVAAYLATGALPEEAAPFSAARFAGSRRAPDRERRRDRAARRHDRGPAGRRPRRGPAPGRRGPQRRASSRAAPGTAPCSRRGTPWRSWWRPPVGDDDFDGRRRAVRQPAAAGHRRRAEHGGARARPDRVRQPDRHGRAAPRGRRRRRCAARRRRGRGRAPAAQHRRLPDGAGGGDAPRSWPARRSPPTG